VDRALAAIAKVQVQAEIGPDFPHALRAILRQDPDIIKIGEIRDLEKARISLQSSLPHVGSHLIISFIAHSRFSVASSHQAQLEAAEPNRFDRRDNHYHNTRPSEGVW
jgi:general secretion pathway protein E